MLWKLGQEKSNIFFLFTYKTDRSLDRIMTDSILLLSSNSFLLSLLHQRAVRLSTLREISAAENWHWKINVTTATDRAPQITLVEKFAKQSPADNEVYIATIPWTKLPVLAQQGQVGTLKVWERFMKTLISKRVFLISSHIFFSAKQYDLNLLDVLFPRDYRSAKF